ncbi:hypothetical protein FRC06_008027 [Ceratobasidium sp. 370]|nr:hypothetical protein FRC06_008027 [Ceratobasidium sp. 370]
MQTGETEVQRVYATLAAIFVDWVARIKCTGHVGIASEHNHCLYCKIRQCYLSLAQGYQRDGYDMRNPVEHLQLKHAWIHAAVPDRRDLYEENGTSFIELDRIPGFYAFDNVPIDGMHLFDHGITPSLVRDIIFLPGMLRKRHRNQPEEESPEGRFNAFVARTYYPSHCSRLPPAIEKMGGWMKADQWRTLLVILPGALFEAWRVGDTIPHGDIPRGGNRSRHFKQQQANASLLLRRRVHAHYDMGGEPEAEPTLEDCAASRNPCDYYRNCLRYFVAYQNLFKHRLTHTGIEDMQALLEQFGRTFVEMNIHLVPSFHCATHIGDHLLRFGNVFGTWLYDFEHANRFLINVNTNGHGRVSRPSQELETTDS